MYITYLQFPSSISIDEGIEMYFVLEEVQFSHNTKLKFNYQHTKEIRVMQHQIRTQVSANVAFKFEDGLDFSMIPFLN